ncbi:FAD-binding oxidoreductase [Jiella avicenniae]|uniref:FAD-binding oxidoreductase n=1 Tax=Jiella avicenniae TaxID=2907202 RepID=A0A9X1P441_9HYPH|nr:FAD-binding oxidoreductase [Jiella avicenniae]MCE7029489.1 FAD-binding oxidoreductase [Jiella avicenniae]
MNDDALAALSEILGDGELLLDEADRARYASDGSGLKGDLPLAVLRPATTERLSQAMAVCARFQIAMITQGGRTGLSGGACVAGPAVVLSTERMQGVVEIDEDAMAMTVWAGTPLERVHDAAREKGLDFPVDIGARGSATVGGLIATNAGGIRVLRHGMMRQNVLGLEVVLADGRILSRLGKLVKDNSGLDLKQIFIGSEGALGVVTMAVLQLKPHAGKAMVVLLALPDFPAALSCLSRARTMFGDRLTAFEGMWPDYWDFVCGEARLARRPVSGTHGFYVLVEIADTDPADIENWFMALSEEGLVEDGILAQSIAEARALWAVREAVGEVDEALGPHINFDLGVASSRLGEFCEACDRCLADVDGAGRALKVGHVGDGNVHLLVAHDGRTETIHDIERAIYGLVAEWGGAITAEHGIGRLKRAWLSCSRSSEEIALMGLLKQALDPAGLLNPGIYPVPEPGADETGRHAC